MENEMKEMGFAVACKTFMGLPGESLQAFQTGFKALTPEDREDLTREFLKIGIIFKK